MTNPLKVCVGMRAAGAAALAERLKATEPARVREAAARGLERSAYGPAHSMEVRVPRLCNAFRDGRVFMHYVYVASVTVFEMHYFKQV